MRVFRVIRRSTYYTDMRHLYGSHSISVQRATSMTVDRVNDFTYEYHTQLLRCCSKTLRSVVSRSNRPNSPVALHPYRDSHLSHFVIARGKSPSYLHPPSALLESYYPHSRPLSTLPLLVGKGSDVRVLVHTR
jgi:hypothetical protein